MLVRSIPLALLVSPSAALACGRSTMAIEAQWTLCSVVGPCVEGAGNHFVGRTQTADLAHQNDHLVVYLPGGGSQPSESEALLRSITKLGFHTIGLSYDTNGAAADPCATRTVEADAQACYEEVRNRLGLGIHDPSYTSLYTVDPADDVEARLVALLGYLDTNDPSGRWGDFLDANGEPVWSEMILVGWSLGAGIAAHIARLEEVQAVVMLDGVKDPYDAGGGARLPAALVPGVTTGCRHWGVYDFTQPEAWMLPDQWTNLGMLLSVDADGESVDGSATSTSGVAQATDRRFYTEHDCCTAAGTCDSTPDLHSTFTVEADTFTDITSGACVKLVGGGGSGEYHLRVLYEDILCTAETETCTN